MSDPKDLVLAGDPCLDEVVQGTSAMLAMPLSEDVIVADWIATETTG
jgi:hypothetical protein